MSCCYEHYLGDEHEPAECERCGVPITVVWPWDVYRWPGWTPTYRCTPCGGPQEPQATEEWVTQVEAEGKLTREEIEERVFV